MQCRCRAEERSKPTIPLQRISAIEPAVIMSVFDSARTRVQTSVCHNHSDTSKDSQDSHLCNVAGVSPLRRAICLPSQRVPSCAHCLLLLLTRLLLVATHDRVAQRRFVNGAHVRSLVDALDTSNDPVSVVNFAALCSAPRYVQICQLKWTVFRCVSRFCRNLFL